MPPRIPKLTHHKASGRGVVRLNGTDFYCGQFGDPATRAEYDQLIAEWLANGRDVNSARAVPTSSGPTVAELMIAFWRHAENHYRHPDGSPTTELVDYRYTLKPLRELYSSLPIAEFTPKKLKAVRERMIQGDLCRKVIHQRVGRIKRMFKWGVSEEIVPETVLGAPVGDRASEDQDRQAGEPVDSRHGEQHNTTRKRGNGGGNMDSMPDGWWECNG